MPEGADSFNATGPTIVGFETTSADTPVKQQFGVSVVGTKCGVYGQGTSGAQMERRSAPFGTGVLGRGDTQGVLGVGFSVDEDNTPDLGGTEAFGVVGVNTSSSKGDAPAVFGDNNFLKKDLSNFSHASIAFNGAKTLPAGVEGISWAGFGVYGISLNLDPDKSPAKDLSDRAMTAVDRTEADRPIFDAIGRPDPNAPPLANLTRPAGVLGLSVQGAGVRGVSIFDRGGIFQSSLIRNVPQLAEVEGLVEDETQPLVAQIRLVPHRVSQLDFRSQNPLLPRAGQTGDLLTVVPLAARGNIKYPSAQLWFCERGVTGPNPSDAAVWRKVALSDTVVGTL